MSVNTDILFESVQLGNLSLNSRIVMAPMTRNFSPGGIPHDGVVEYYRRRAANSVGLIVTEGVVIDHVGANGYPDVPYMFGEQALAGWKKVVDAVHSEGGKIFPQLWHVGAVRRKGTGPEPEAPAYGPMGKEKNGEVQIKAMSQQDIDEVIASFTRAAADAKRIGFDGIELHGAHGYLIDQFFWEASNQRTDQYGGSFENRARFAIEIVKAVREVVGPDFPIQFRYSQWKQQDYSARLCETSEQLGQLLGWLADAGVDIFHASTRRFWLAEFEGSDLNLAGWTRKLTGKPTITVGSVGLDSDFLEYMVETDKVADTSGVDSLVERLNNSEFDLVAVGRALLVDGEWANKVRDGRFEDIVPFSRKALTELT